MRKKEVKPCPHCGSKKYKVESKKVLDGYLLDTYRVMRKTFSVRCNACFARGGAVGGKVIESYEHFISEHELPEWATTEEQLIEQAVKKWNRRAEAETSVSCAEWVYDKYMYAHCSECGYEHESPEYVTPFCPGCGAKMEDEEENKNG